MITNTKLCYKFAPLFDPNVKDIVEGSGRASGKTTSNEISAINLMLQSKYNNIWYCRAEKGDVRSTIFSSLISTAQQMGVDKLFTWKLNPMVVICNKTGARCYFDGINGKTDDDMTATKGFTPQHKTLAMCILDESDQVKHYNHITAWKTTAVRYLLPSGKMVYAYNPPMNKNHWAYKYFGDMVRNGATNIYTTWEDIRGLLNDRVIADIEKFRRDDPEYYRYWYLGQPVNFQGLVYPQFKRETHVIDIWEYIATTRDKVYEVVFGLDEGTVNDSTCCTCLAIMESGVAVVLDCIEIDPLVTGQKSPSEVSRLLSEYLEKCFNNFPFLMSIPRQWIFECAEGGQMLMLQFQEDTDEPCVPVTQKSITGDIKRVRNMLSEGILKFHIGENTTTEVLVTDIENYVFDEKTGDVKKQQRDDTIDSMEYATKGYYNVPISHY